MNEYANILKEKLHQFTNTYSDKKDYRGYRLLAVDGSCLAITATSGEDGTPDPNRINTTAFVAPTTKAVFR